MNMQQRRIRRFWGAFGGVDTHVCRCHPSSICELYFSNAAYIWYIKFESDSSSTQFPTNSEYNSKIMDILQMAIFVVQLWMGDGFMLFRLWKVWSNDRRVVLPITVGFLANIALGILLVYTSVAEDLSLVGKESGTQSSLGAVLSVPVIMSVYSLSFVVHLACTVMIAGRILYLDRRVSRWVRNQARTRSTAMAVILLESGLLYSAAMLCLLITSHYTFAGGYNSAHIVMNAIVPLIGITFSILIIRMGLGISTEARLRAQAGGEIHSGPSSAIHQNAAYSMMLFASRSRSSVEEEPKLIV